jgi:hypothetical protein
MERSRPKDTLQVPKTKIVVYTALFGDKDLLWSVPPGVVPGAKYIVFTEKPRREVGLWTYDFGLECPAIIKGTEGVASPVRFWEQRIVKAPYRDRKSARYYKVMAHKVLRGVDVSIWVDANVRLLLLPEVALKQWLCRRDLAVFKHAVRGGLFEEARTCIIRGVGNKDLIKRQIKAYRQVGMPRNWGLASTRCVVRRHTAKMAQLNEAWWNEIQKFSLRDQISLPYVCWREGLRWEHIPKSVRTNKDYWFLPHGRKI